MSTSYKQVVKFCEDQIEIINDSHYADTDYARGQIVAYENIINEFNG